MIRRIIRIDEEKCNGCSLCIDVCHEGAIHLNVRGRAELLREDFCDGLGDCLPACPANAITFEEREAPAYDAAAVAVHKKEPKKAMGTPGLTAGARERRAQGKGAVPGCLENWPVQLRLTPAHAPFFAAAQLLVAADCTAFAYGSLHQDFMAGRVTLIGCPKLDSEDYAKKLTQIFGSNDIRSVTVLRMEVPCCGGLERAVRNALRDSGKTIPCEVVTIASDGSIAS